MKNGFHVFSRISTQQNPLHWLGLFLCMLLFAASSAWATGGTMSGSGTLRDPYIISDAADWRAFARAVYLNGNTYENKYIKLGADITVTQKVGDYTDGMPFSGTFNGDGHTITADISQTSQNPFSTDPFRSQNINGAALFSYIKGATIENLTVAGSITGGIHSAGLVGYADGAKVANYVEGQGVVVTGKGNEIINCVVTATIKGGTHIGGILGHGRSSDITIRGCVFKGKLVGGSTAKGVFFGWGDDGGSKKVYNNLYIMQEGQDTRNLDLVKMSAGYVTGDRNYKTADVGSYGNLAYLAAPANGPFSFVKGTAVDGTEYYIPASSSDNPVVIGSVADWNAFASAVNSGYTCNGEFIRLDADITVTQKVGDLAQGKFFSGTFDGNGHTITAAINESGTAVALFGNIKGATIKNLTLTGSVTGGIHTAGLVGASNGSGNRIENTVVAATITGGSHIGGILGHGRNSDIAIDNCVFKGKLEGGTTAKGVFFGWGDNGGTKSVSNCLYIMQQGQNTTGLDLAKMSEGSVSVTNSYKTAGVGNYGTLVYLQTESAPANALTFVEKTAVDNTKFYVVDKAVTMSGSGTEADPFIVSDASKWNEFANIVNGGYSFAGKFLKLGQNISVTQKAGIYSRNKEKPFSGTFDGGKHTITANITETDGEYLALFGYINGATIRNLSVAGSVTGRIYSAGLVGASKGTGNRIENCIVAATVTGSYIGGIVGYDDGGNLVIDNCVFKGKLEGGGSYMGVFLGDGPSSVGSGVSITNSLYIMQEGQKTVDLDLARLSNYKDRVNMTSCYKTADIGTYGTLVYLNKPGNSFAIEKTAADGTKFYVTLPKDDDGYYVNMPHHYVKEAEIPPGVTSFKLYDDGGKDGVYSRNSSGTLRLIAPEGYIFHVAGTARLESGRTLFTVYDGGTDKPKLMESKGGTVNGISLLSTGNLMTVYFESNQSEAPGLDLTVSVIQDIERTITCKNDDLGGTVSCDKSSAKFAEKVSLTVTPPQGYSFYGYQITGEGYDNTVIVEGSHTGETTVTFSMPAANITVVPKFIKDLRGDGSKANPYIIGDADDWDLFVANVNGGNTYAGKFFKLGANITVSKKVGVVVYDTPVTPFSGIFDGDGFTITAAIDDQDNSGTALFSYIEGATVMNLTVAGSIVGATHTAGVVGYSKGTWVSNKIQNVIVTATVKGGSHIGGILGHGISSDIAIDNCIFKGKLVGGWTAKGVLFGWGDKGGTKSVTNSLYISQDGQDFSNLDLVKVPEGSVSVTDCYKTSNIGIYGALAFLSKSAVPAGATTVEKTAADGTTLYVLTGFESGEIPVTQATTTMTTGTYRVFGDVGLAERINISGDVKLVLDEGATLNATKGIELSSGNKLTIDGKGTLNAVGAIGSNNCSGIGATNVGTLVIDGGVINASGDYSAAGIGGSYRGGGGSVTINGGIVTASGGSYAAAIGGGSYGEGVVIAINGGQVTANAGANGAFGIGSGFKAANTSSVTLSWTNEDDFVLASSYNVESITFNKPSYYMDGASKVQVTATTETNVLDGKKIVPNKNASGGEPLTIYPTPTFTVNCVAPDNSWKISCDKSSAKAGEAVSLTITPPKNLMFKGFEVSGEGIQMEKTLQERGGAHGFRQYCSYKPCYWFSDEDLQGSPVSSSFTMPAGNVTVTPTYWTEFPFLYVSMPNNGNTSSYTIPKGVKSFHVYDDGGPDKDYSIGSVQEFLVLTAPEGYNLKVDGSASLEPGASLTVCDGTYSQPTGSSYYNCSGRDLGWFSLVSYGGRLNIHTDFTWGNVMTLRWDVSEYATKVSSGFYITVTVEPHPTYTITYAGGIRGSTDRTEPGNTVSFVTAPPLGYVLDTVEIKNDKQSYVDVAITGGKWWSDGGNNGSFVMPNTNVSVTPKFILATDIAVNMPRTGLKNVKIPANVTTFKVYDVGGKDGGYWYDNDGTLALTAPEGYSLELEGSLNLYDANDVFKVFDGNIVANANNAAAPLLEKRGVNSTIPTVRSTGREMTLTFTSDNSGSADGLDLTVKVVPQKYSITYAEGISGKAEALAGETVVLVAEPPADKMLSSVEIKKTDGELVDYALLGNSASFVMAASAVTVTPVFTDKVSDEEAYVNMPCNGVKNIAIPSEMATFKVYDDGGKDGNYSPYCDGYLTMSAPKGYIFKVDGKASEPWWVTGDYLIAYDGVSSISNSLVDLSGYWWDDSRAYDGKIHSDGTVHFYSTGTDMKLYFHTDGKYEYSGDDYALDLTVTLVKNEFAVTCADNVAGGTVACNKNKARYEENVSFDVTPQEGQYFWGFDVTGENYAMHAMSPKVEFEMPPLDVTVSPLFTDKPTAESGLYVNMPVTGTKKVTIPAGVESFKVYDDGGKDGPYSDNCYECDAYLELTAPEGYVLKLKVDKKSSGGRLRSYNSSGIIGCSNYDMKTGDECDSYGRFLKLSFQAYYDYNNDNEHDFELTVTVIPAYTITYADGVSGSAERSKPGETIKFTVTPPEGQYLVYTEVKDEKGNLVDVVGGTWYSGTYYTGSVDLLFDKNRGRFFMPASNVTVTPVFTDNPTAEGGLYVNMFATDVEIAIPTGVESFKVYDDGGKAEFYSNGYSGRFELYPHGGYILELSGSVDLALDNDYFRVYDGYYFDGIPLTDKIVGSTTVPAVRSTSDGMALYFESDDNGNAAGLDLTVKVVPKKYSIEYADGITGDKTEATFGEIITLMATPPAGQSFEGFVLMTVRIKNNGTVVEKTLEVTDFVISGNNMGSFTLPNPRYSEASSLKIYPVFSDNLNNGGFVKMPKTGTRIVAIPDGITTFSVYDDGGKEGNYSDNVSGTLTLTAPEGYLLHVTGGAEFSYGDFWTAYDGGTDNRKFIDQGGNISGLDLLTSGNTMTLYLESNKSGNASGLDLSVTVVPADQNHSVTCVEYVDGGSISCDKLLAKRGDVVSVNATPDEGYVLSGIRIYGNGYGDGDGFDQIFEALSATEATFTMPYANVTVWPKFSPANASDAYYVTLPASGSKNVLVPPGVTTFKVYDDGGKSANYTSNCEGSLVLTAPEGYILQVEGTKNTDYGNISIFDGDISAKPLLDNLHTSGESIIGPLASSNNVMTIYFKGAYYVSSQNYGLDLTVTVIKAEILTITEADGKKTATINGNYGGTEILSIEKDTTVDNVVFNREFPKNTYATMVLPFSVNTANVEGLNAALRYNGIGKDKNGKDAIRMKVVWATSDWVEKNQITDANGALMQYVAADLTANTPYLIQMGDATFKVNQPVTLKKTATAEVSKDGWTFRGTWQYKKWGAFGVDPETGWAYGFAASASEESNIKVGDFVKVGEGAWIRPMRAYLVKSEIPESASQGIRANGNYVMRPTVVQQELPELMSVIVDSEDGNEEHTTVIGHFNTRTGEFNMNNAATKRTFDVKGRNVGNKANKARGAYYGKKAKK